MPRGGHVERLRPTVGGCDGGQRHAVDPRVPSGVGAFSEDEGAESLYVPIHTQLRGTDRGGDTAGGFNAHACRRHSVGTQPPDGTGIRIADLFEPSGSVETGGQRDGSARTEGHEDRVDVVRGQSLNGGVVGVDDQGICGLGERGGGRVTQGARCCAPARE